MTLTGLKKPAQGIDAPASRVARSNKDWHQLIELCAVFHTLLADQDNRTDDNDRLLLGLKGVRSKAELHILRGRPGDENAWHTFRENELPKIIDRARGVEVLEDRGWRTVGQSRNALQRLIYADQSYVPKTRTVKTAYGPFEMTPYQHARLVTALRAHSGPAAISGYRCEDMTGGSEAGGGSNSA